MSSNRKILAVLLVTNICMLLFVLFTTAGCAQREPSAGVVTEQDYDPARKGKPADWDITIKQDVDGKEVEYDVSRKVHDACEVGDRWPDCRPA